MQGLLFCYLFSLAGKLLYKEFFLSRSDLKLQTDKKKVDNVETKI